MGVRRKKLRLLNIDDVGKFIALKLGRIAKEVWIVPISGSKPFLTCGHAQGASFVGVYTNGIAPDELLEDVLEAQKT